MFNMIFFSFSFDKLVYVHFHFIVADYGTFQEQSVSAVSSILILLQRYVFILGWDRFLCFLQLY